MSQCVAPQHPHNEPCSCNDDHRAKIIWCIGNTGLQTVRKRNYDEQSRDGLTNGSAAGSTDEGINCFLLFS